MADPALDRAKPWPEKFLKYRFRDWTIFLALEQDLHGAFWKGDLAGKAHQIFVPDTATHPRGLEEILEVMRIDQIV